MKKLITILLASILLLGYGFASYVETVTYTNPDGSVLTIQYTYTDSGILIAASGNQVYPDGTRAVLVYMIINSQAKVTDKITTCPYGSVLTEEFRYSSSGTLLSATGNQVYPDGTHAVLSYRIINDQAKVESKTTAYLDGSVLVELFAYNSSGTLVSATGKQVYPDGTQALLTYMIIYDQAKVIEKVTTYSDGSVLTEEFTYNSAGTLIGSTGHQVYSDGTQAVLTYIIINGQAKVKSKVTYYIDESVLIEDFIYNASGTLMSATGHQVYPDGTQAVLTYIIINGQAKVKSKVTYYIDESVLVENFIYNASGTLMSATGHQVYPDGTQAVLTYIIINGQAKVKSKVTYYIDESVLVEDFTYSASGTLLTATGHQVYPDGTQAVLSYMIINGQAKVKSKTTAYPGGSVLVELFSYNSSGTLVGATGHQVYPDGTQAVLTYMIINNQAKVISKVYTYPDNSVITVSYIYNAEGELINTSISYSSDALFAYYPFDSNANDFSGNNLNGTNVNGAKYTEGVINNSLCLDGINDYVKINNYSYFNSLDDFTITAWIYPTRFNANNTIISKVNPGRDFVLELLNNKLSIHFYNNGYKYCTATQNLNLYTWYHVSASWNGYEAKLYINGELVKICVFPGFTRLETGTRVGIGTMNFSYSNLFKGNIDNLKVYNKELCLPRIEAEYEFTSQDIPNVKSFYADDANEGYTTYDEALILDSLAEDGINVYPIPATNILNIESGDIIKDPCFEIYNISGELIIREEKYTNDKKFSISLTGINQGLYILKIITPGGIVNKKIVIN